jgi:hypothetical protein
VSSPNYQRQIIPAAASICQFYNLVHRISAAQYELIKSVLRVGSRNTAQSSATTSADMEAEHVEVSVDSIRARAYEIYERRGRRPGSPLDDWDRAKAELRAEAGGATS